jgi:hypothetical protein
MARRKARDNAGGGSGTVTQVNTGIGLTGGPITTTGTVELDSKLAPLDSLTGNALKVPRVNAGETALEYVTPTPAPVDSVNGQTGVVSLDTDDVPEGTNKYFPGVPGNTTELILNLLGLLGSSANLTFDPATNTFSVNDLTNPNGLKLIVNLTTGEGSMLINGVGIKVLPALTYIGNTNFNPGDAYMEFANGGMNYTLPHGDFRITGTAGETINFQSTGGTPSTSSVTFVGTLPAYGGNTELLGTPGAWLYMENNGVPGVIPWYAL